MGARSVATMPISIKKAKRQGDANYDIPLKASPGTAGMTPQLSIHYDSSGGNGLMGMGFNLQGLTASRVLRRITHRMEKFIQ